MQKLGTAHEDSPTAITTKIMMNVDAFTVLAQLRKLIDQAWNFPLNILILTLRSTLDYMQGVLRLSTTPIAQKLLNTYWAMRLNEPLSTRLYVERETIFIN